MDNTMKRRLSDSSNSTTSKSPRVGTTLSSDEAPKPAIRVRGNLTEKSEPLSLESDRKLPSDKLEEQIKRLKEEVRALHWLARRKEQEWDSIIRLTKLKEERLLRAERQHRIAESGIRHVLKKVHELTKADARTLMNGSISEVSSNFSPAIVSTTSLASTDDNDDIEIIAEKPKTATVAPQFPTQLSQLLQASTAPAVSFLTPVHTVSSCVPTLLVSNVVSDPILGQSTLLLPKQHLTLEQITRTKSVVPGSIPQKIPATSSQRPAQSSSHSNSVRTSRLILPKPSSVVSSSALAVPKFVNNITSCQFCHQKPSKFLCSGCSKRSYCSRPCQEKDWDVHADMCC